MVLPPRAAAPLSSPAAAPPIAPDHLLSEGRATIGSVPLWDDGPLVGRAEELDRLLAAVDRVRTGRFAAVLLAGDAGVGKTRLLDELATRAAARGVRVLTGHCVDLGEVGLRYLPFVDLLRPVAARSGAGPGRDGRPGAGRAAGRSPRSGAAGAAAR